MDQREGNEAVREGVDRLERENRELKKQLGTQSEFINYLVHDLRAPLTAIKSYADLLLRYREEKEEIQQQFLLTIAGEAERMHCLINDFLDLSKMEQGMFVCQHETVDMARLADYFLGVFEGVRIQKEIHLFREYEEGLPCVLGDPQRLGQVMTNLISNAIKFTPRGGNIRICMRSIDRMDEKNMNPQNRLVISLEDSGQGIPERDRLRIFDKYFQLENRRTEGIPGTGLGLPIVKQIIENHGGELRVEKGKLGGSAFIFELPCAVESPVDACKASG